MPNVGNVAFSGVLAPNTVLTVTLNEARGSIRVTIDAATGVYFTVADDGVTPTAPTVGGVDCYHVPPVVGATEEVIVGQAPVEVSLISAGAVPFTVESDHPTRH